MNVLLEVQKAQGNWQKSKMVLVSDLLDIRSRLLLTETVRYENPTIACSIHARPFLQQHLLLQHPSTALPCMR
jgi:hypothetical protein